MIEVLYERGIHLPASALWLDSAVRKPLSFVSHAHSDHIARHSSLIATSATARLLQHRLPGRREEILLPFLQPLQLAESEITLLPAGHVLGSAQLFLQNSAGSLLYTGDFKLRPSLSTESADWRHAETLIMETTYGLPKYCMPPSAEVLAQVIAFCRQTLDQKAIPILLVYSLGKAQEVICALLQAQLQPMLHSNTFALTEIYREFNAFYPTGYLPFSPEEVKGKVLIWPPNCARSESIGKIGARKTAVLTGWALDSGAVYRHKVDAAFPLTDHADYPDLLRYVELVQPRRVFTHHGFSTAFARDLRARGIEAWALGQANQLEFQL